MKNPLDEVTKGQQLGARETILSKIRRAVQIPAPKPGAHQPPPGLPLETAKGEGKSPQNLRGNSVQLPVLNGPQWQQWLPPVGASWDDWATLFARNAEGLKADFRLLENESALRAALKQLSDENNWQRVAFQADACTQSALANLNLPSLEMHSGYDRDELEKCDAGITLCDALIAQTGSVLMTAQSAGGRALSVLPPHHVVIARREQLVPDLSAAFALLREKYGDDLPSLIGFITGPSRTGDIERILVLGAHGPKQLTIFCV